MMFCLMGKSENKVKRLELPFRIYFVANNKLKNKLCFSRPYDKKACKFNKCRICPKIESNNIDCSLKNAANRVDRKICGQFFMGETERTLHERMGEHLRYASYPKTPSNRNQALAIHYLNHHSGVIPDLQFSILALQPNTAKRKILEALTIIKLKPQLAIGVPLNLKYIFSLRYVRFSGSYSRLIHDRTTSFTTVY